MNIAIYLSTNKEREVEIGRALSDGFRCHGEEVQTLPTEGYSQPQGGTQIAVMVGVKGRSKQIFEDHRRASRHTLLIDKSYFGRKDYYRVALDGFQPRYAHDVKRPTDRLDRIGVKFQPMSGEGRHIIYAGSSQKYCDWWGLGDASEFAGSVCGSINKRLHSALPIYYRPKPSWAAMHPEEVRLIPGTEFFGPGESFVSRLPNCFSLVTHGSNAALEAIAAGVPVVLVSKEGASAAWPLAGKNLNDDILRPPLPSDEERLQVFADLAYCQFTLKEMASGLVWETLLPHTIKGISGFDGMSERAQRIEMYRLMHRSHKMFRGNSLKGHTEQIANLVKEHGPENLLDHGCGKGLQYDELRLHDRWGGLKPVCYDPGYEPLAKKPEGKFDGVISTDVAEHIPESDVDEFLLEVIGYANKFAFFCIFTGPSRKFLPDGRNCHLTQRPAEWWLDKITKLTSGERIAAYMVRKALPGGASEDFPHYQIQVPGGPRVVVTFRGEE